AAGAPDGSGPGGAGGGEAGAGADLRGGLPSVLVRLPAEAQRDAGARAPAHAGSTWRKPRVRRRHPRLLRQHRSRATDEARGDADLGPEGPQAGAAVARSRRDGRWPGDGDALGDPPGWRDLTAAVEHLPRRPRRSEEHTSELQS